MLPKARAIASWARQGCVFLWRASRTVYTRSGICRGLFGCEERVGDKVKTDQEFETSRGLDAAGSSCAPKGRRRRRRERSKRPRNAGDGEDCTAGHGDRPAEDGPVQCSMHFTNTLLLGFPNSSFSPYHMCVCTVLTWILSPMPP